MNQEKINYNHLSIDELNQALNNLQIAVKNYIMTSADAETKRYEIMNAKQKKILATYPIRIWQASNGTWKAHIPDDSKPRNRRIVQGKNLENLEKNILEDYYKNVESRLIFSTYFANWLMNYKSTIVKPPTIQRNFDDYSKYIKGKEIDSMKIDKITRMDIKKCLNEAINEYHLTRKSLNNLKSIFNGMFNYAYDVNDITSNPTLNLKIENTNIRQESLKQPKTEVFNESELSTFIDYIYQHYLEYRPIVSLAILLNFQLGLRVGELCTLKHSDIDMNHKTLAIQRMERSYRPIEMVNGKLVKQETIHVVTNEETKCNSSRIIDLSDEAIQIIKEAKRLQKEASIVSEYLFADVTGKNIIRQRINDCLRFYCNRIQIDTKSSHKIRKTVLSNLFNNKFDLDEIMKISGHRNKSTLLKHYIFSTKNQGNTQERISQALSTGHRPLVNPNQLTLNPEI